MSAFMSDEGDNKSTFRRMNGELAQRVWDKLSSRGATIEQIDPNWKTRMAIQAEAAEHDAQPEAAE